MNYTLALALKKAGFPQRNLSESPFGSALRDEEVVANPTLSELIAECGEKLQALYKSQTFWNATDQNPLYNDWDNYAGLHCDGVTPEEAVANLYLALHEAKIKP